MKPTRRVIVIANVAVTASLVGVSTWAAMDGTGRAHAAPVPSGGGGGVSATLDLDQAIPVLDGTSSTGAKVGGVQPGQSYTVVCYTDGDTVTNTRTKSSSPHWALIADPANPGASLGYVPAIALNLTDIAAQTSV